MIPGVGRVVRGEPFRLNGYEIPPGVEINPSIRMIHRRADLYPEPARSAPSASSAPTPPDTYTWIPFGGGTRRCLGASFALMEMRVVLRRVLERGVAARRRPGAGREVVPRDHAGAEGRRPGRAGARAFAAGLRTPAADAADSASRSPGCA